MKLFLLFFFLLLSLESYSEGSFQQKKEPSQKVSTKINLNNVGLAGALKKGQNKGGIGFGDTGLIGSNLSIKKVEENIFIKALTWLFNNGYLAIFVYCAITLISSITRFLLKKKEGQTRRKKTFAKKSNNNDEETSQIAHLGATDAAITSLEDDELGTGELSKGLSLFIQNKETKAPLSIAVTGDWGSGKSSIMGMMYEHLEMSGYRPIWFNAWHHHRDKHFFGALLEIIRKEAVPSPLTSQGFWFWSRLLFRRLWRSRNKIFLMTFFILLALYFYNYGEGIIDKQVMAELKKYEKTGSTLVGLFSLFGLKFVLDIFSVFGFNIKDLLSMKSSVLHNLSVTEDPGLRYRVNQALEDIIFASGRKELVIFIDDLDRCPPEEILDVLENVSFLSSHPKKCYTILGVALNRILPAISGKFEHVVAESAGSDDQEQLKRARRNYARSYLEKLINIEIHTPAVDDQGLTKLVKRQHERSRWENICKAFRKVGFLRWADRLIFPVLLLAILGTGIRFGVEYYKAEKKVAKLERRLKTQGKSLDTSTRMRLSLAETSAVKSNLFVWGWSLFLIVATLILARFFDSRTEQVEDSDAFSKAIKIWSPLLTYTNNNPRYYKRTLNHLRLLAMRLTHEPENKLQDERIVNFIMFEAFRKSGVADDYESLTAFYEAILPYSHGEVSWERKYSDEKNSWTGVDLTQHKIGTSRGKLADTELLKMLAITFHHHQKAFGYSWPPLEDKHLFEHYTQHVVLN